MLALSALTGLVVSGWLASGHSRVAEAATVGSLGFDCDLLTVGYQGICDLPPDTTSFEVAVGFTNHRPTSVTLAEFTITIRNREGDLYVPTHFAGSGIDGNPNFNEAAFSVGWACQATSDTAEIADGATYSYLNCATDDVGTTVAAGAFITLATVRYDVIPGQPVDWTQLHLRNVVLNDSAGSEIGTCSPVVSYEIGCFRGQVRVPPIPTATPTATSTPAINTAYPYLALDCDVDTAGIQLQCDIPANTGLVVVDVVLANAAAPQTLAALNFDIAHPDHDRLRALTPPCGGAGVDCNPDLDQLSIPQNGWSCGLPLPAPDGSSAPGDQSKLSCYNTEAHATLPAFSLTRIARMRYEIPANAPFGAVTLALNTVNAADEVGVEFLACAPGPQACYGAAINILEPDGPFLTATPTTGPAQPTTTPTSAGTGTTPTSMPSAAYFAAIDCDANAPGWQSYCTYPLGTDQIEVGVVLHNDGTIQNLDVFQGVVVVDGLTSLDPYDEPPDEDGNPDYTEAGMGPAFSCSLLLPNNSVEGQTIRSEIGCGTLASPAPAVPVGGVQLFTVTYGLAPDAPAGAFQVSLDDFAFEDVMGQLSGGCPQAPSMVCTPATIELVGPVVAMAPEGNAANTLPSAPAANLWLCGSGCSGPGEGELVVNVDAYGLAEGLGAYSFTLSYDPATISSVQPCDIVFGVTGAGASRGPVDEADTSAANPDCSPDPGAGASGACAFSPILESLAHFGCVSAGAAPGPEGDVRLASVLLVPVPILANDLLPVGGNGIVSTVDIASCRLIGSSGSPVPGSNGDGFVERCGDVSLTVRILEGDLDQDCQVDVTDAQMVASRFGSFFGGTAYTKRFDVEPAAHDLDVDIKDVQRILGRDQSTCQEPIPPQQPLED